MQEMLRRQMTLQAEEEDLMKQESELSQERLEELLSRLDSMAISDETELKSLLSKKETQLFEEFVKESKNLEAFAEEFFPFWCEYKNAGVKVSLVDNLDIEETLGELELKSVREESELYNVNSLRILQSHLQTLTNRDNTHNKDNDEDYEDVDDFEEVQTSKEDL